MFIFVFRTENVPEIVRELSSGGWTLTREKHGEGPEHFSIAIEDGLVEIYPSTRERPCDRCADRIVEDQPATICRSCLTQLLANIAPA